MNFFHRTCCLFLAFFFLLAIPTRAAEKQQASFANVELLQDEMVAGIRGLAIRFDVRMKYRGDAVLEKGESSIPYTLSVWLFDEYGVPLAATSDAETYMSPLRQCRDSMSLVQGKFHQEFKDEVMFIPYYAMALLPGKRNIRLELRLKDRRTGVEVGKSRQQVVAIHKPAVKRFRMAMKYIEVTEKDGNGDTWDYYFLNPKEVLPDIRWSLRRGEEFVFIGERKKNLVIYEGDPEADRTAYFTLSEGDKLTLYVRDFDLISFSDEIGTIELDPWEGRMGEGKVMDLKFGQVVSALFQVDNLAEPRMLLSGFEVLENVQEQGVAGVRVQVDYQLEYNILGARFEVHLHELIDGISEAPRFVRVISGPAEALGEGRFRLSSNKGKVHLFVPWYGLQDKAGKRSLLRLSGRWRLDEQEFAMGMEQRELLNPHPPLKDMVFGQWKAGQSERNGMAGILFSCEYKMSGRYLEDLEGATIRLFPEMESQLGPIPAGYLLHIAPEAGEWEDNALVLTPKIDSGSLDLFLPYHQMPQGLNSLDLKFDYHADLSWEGRMAALGVFRLQQEIGLPEIRNVTLAVREVAASRNGILGKQPNLEWRVRIGEKEMYRSRTIYESKPARWEPEESVTLRLTDQDLVKIEIYQVAGEQVEKVSGWEGRMRDFPVNPNGIWKLKVEGLKRVLVKID